MRKESAAALVIVLTLISLISAALITLFTSHNFKMQLREHRLHSSFAINAARSKALRSLAEAGSAPGYSVREYRVQRGKIEAAQKIAWFESLTAVDSLAASRLNPTLLSVGESMPRWNFNPSGLPLSTCSSLPWDAGSGRTLGGALLEGASNKVLRSCVALGPATPPLFLPYNVELTELQLKSPQLTILGYTAIANLVLELPSSTILVGGDIQIENLNCPLDLGCSVFMISQSGSISVKAISGLARIKSFSKLGDNLSGFTQSSVEQVWPTLLSKTVLALE